MTTGRRASPGTKAEGHWRLEGRPLGKGIPSGAMETRETRTGISASIRQETDQRKKVLGEREGFISPSTP